LVSETVSASINIEAPAGAIFANVSLDGHTDGERSQGA
jgi:hypothetical protein